MVSFARQYRLLIWKNWLLVQRKPVVTIFEILIPTLLSLVLLILRSHTKADVIVNSQIFDSFVVGDNLPENLTSPVSQKIPATEKILLYTPINPLAEKIINSVQTRLGIKKGISFKSESDMAGHFVQSDGETILAAVAFRNLDSEKYLPNNIRYAIRPKPDTGSGIEDATLEQTYAWSTNLMYPSNTKPNAREADLHGLNYPGYYKEGFLTLQRAIDFGIIEAFGANSTLDEYEIRLKRFPDPPTRHDPFVSVLQERLPLIIMLSFVISASTICKDIVEEKEKKLKESMKLMGMKSYLYWLAWMLKFILLMMISVAIMTLILHVKTDKGAMITYTNPSVTFVFLMLFSGNVIVLCCAISTFFSHASSAAAAGAIIYIVFYMPYFFLSFRIDSVSQNLKMILSLDINLAMAFGCLLISQYEDIGIGLHWYNLNKPVNINNVFTMSNIFIMMVVDIFYLSLITWYFDALLPGDFGTPQPFYFPFTSWYWYGRPDNTILLTSKTKHVDLPYYGDRAEFFELEHPDAEVGIQIRHLRKVFPGAVKPSVVDLTVDLYVGEITALLGHNGAGKTTTMYMLTGFLPPTEGTAYINGLDIRRDMVRIRQNLGLCPQHDILFDKLTVVEHLTFFAMLKGCPVSEIKQEVDHMVSVLHLENKRKTYSKNLSGGMKRKLSVGIALIAGSKFVILDEPTSGMDPEARRETWDILLNQRKDRTIILSTHFMDEADLLGDRIAIMADGELKCCGTSMFLKKKYGIGYHLTIVRNSKSKSKRIYKLIKTFIPEVRLESKVGAELSYILPREKAFIFQELFNAIERNRLSLGIDSYGASVTTMEDVFIRVGEPGESAGKKVAQVEHSVGFLPVKTTISGIAATESVPSESSMSSVYILERPASTSFLNRNLRSISSSFANQQSSVLLSYLTTKLAKLKESRSKKNVSDVKPKETAGKVDTVNLENLDTVSIISEAASEVSDTHWDELPVPALLKKTSDDLSDVSETFSRMPIVASSQELPQNIIREVDSKKPTQMHKVRREMSNPEMKKSTTISDVGDWPRRNIGLKGVPEDDMEQSKISLASSDSSADSGEAIFADFKVVTGIHLLLQHYRAMLIKRIIHSWRNRLITLVQIVVTLVFLIIGCVIERYMISESEPIALELTLDRFKNTMVPVTIDPKGVNIAAAEKLKDAYIHVLENSAEIYDIGHRSIDDYLLELAKKNAETYRRYVVVAGSFNSTSEVNKSIIGHFSNEAFHVIAISLSLVDLTLLRQLIGKNHSITTINHPLPNSINFQTSNKIIFERMAGFVLTYCLTFGIAFLIGTFIIFPIKEQTVSSRRLQFVSGLTAVNYWISTFMWDVMNFVLPSILILCVLRIFNIKALTSNHNLGYVLVLLLFYCWAMLPLTYLQSFAFTEASAGYAWSTIMNILSDTVAMIAVYVCKMPGIQSLDVADALEWFFYVTLPNYCFSDGIQSLWENHVNINLCEHPEMKRLCSAIRNTSQTNLCCLENCGTLCARRNKNYLGIERPGIGRALIFLSMHCVLYFIILIFVELIQANLGCRRILSGSRFNFVHRNVADFSVDESGQDGDVMVEKKHVTETPLQELLSENILLIKEVSKIYSNDFLAVDRLTIAIKPGECFGLLGINGAGKTTTFKMLTGDVLITSGQCYLDGFDINYNLAKAYSVLGYCPQFDALIDQMTVTETLWMYSRLRGICEKDIANVVNNLISLVLLEKHKRKQACKLSGGNRRKLSTAIALTGNPKIIFLDEPTTGMDPGARRLLWNTLAKVRESGRTLILTSHSMEECEALCTRLAIMVNGRFKCLGNKQHLKTKFGRGYTVIIKVRSTGDLSIAAEKIKKLIDFFIETFPGSTLKDRHEGLVHFHVHTIGATWANIFGTMERIKTDFNIEDYSVSQTTLEQVFISFARVQEAKTMSNLTCGQKCSKVCCPR